MRTWKDLWVGKKPNKEQIKSVEHIESDLLVLAGPGTGKTAVIVGKCLYLIIDKKVDPKKILCLTFSEKAAEEMNERINSTLPKEYNKIKVSTFHSFCNEIFQDYSLQFKGKESKLIGDVEKYMLLRENWSLFEIENDELRENKEIYIDKILNFIEKLHNWNITVNDFKEFINSGACDQIYRDYFKIYEKFQKIKEGDNLIDFGDMINKVINIFKEDKKFLEKYHQLYEYVIIDEYQDTNFSQFELIDLLSKTGAHISIVSDDDQCIYEFRGAYSSNIKAYRALCLKNGKKIKEKTLKKIYRFHENILKVSQRFINATKEDENKKELEIHGKKEQHRIQVITTKEAEDEAKFIADEILCLRKYGYFFKDIAILSRNNSPLDIIAKTLDYYKIPFEINTCSVLSLLKEIKDLTAYLNLICFTNTASTSLLRVLQSELYNFDDVTLKKVFNKLDFGTEFFNLIDELDKIIKNKELDKIFTSKLRELIEQIKLLKKLSKKCTLTEFFHHLLYVTGYLINVESKISSLEKKEATKNINYLFGLCEDFESKYPERELNESVNYLNTALNLSIERSEGDVGLSDEDSVKLMTIHRSKGTEFKTVFIIKMVQGHCPMQERDGHISIPQHLLINKSIEVDFGESEEERRLFYVAMTRAKERLYLTLSQHYKPNKRNKNPSPFLKDIGIELNGRNYSDDLFDVTYLNSNSNKLLDIASDFQVLLNKNAKNVIKNDLPNAIKLLVTLYMFNESATIEKEFVNLVMKDKYEEWLQFIKAYRYTDLIDIANFKFNPSNLLTYQDCPLKFKYENILRVYVSPDISLQFGSAIHKTLERYYLKFMESQSHNFQLLKSIFNEEFSKIDYKDVLKKDSGLKKGLLLIERFYENEFKKKTKVKDVEYKNEIKVGDFLVNGKIDRIDVLNGESHIYDYKTGYKNATRSVIEKELFESPQTYIYPIIVNTKIKSIIYYLLENKNLEWKKELPSNYREKWIESVDEMIKRVLKSDFRPIKDEFSYCRYCNFKNNCIAFEVNPIEQSKDIELDEYLFILWNHIFKNKSINEAVSYLIAYYKLKNPQLEVPNEFSYLNYKEIIDLVPLYFSKDSTKKSKLIDVHSFIFSPTTLESYDICPYQFKLQSVYKFGFPKGESAIFGTVIHNTLQEHNELQNKNLSKLTEIFKKELNRIYIKDEKEKNKLIKRGESLLKHFFELEKRNKNSIFRDEDKIDFSIKDIKFVSKIDRIDEDDKSNLIIYDYKTGKIKTDPSELKREFEKGYQKDVYSLALKYYYGKIPLKVIFYILENRKLKEKKIEYNISEENIDEYEKRVLKLIDSISKENFQPKVNVHGTCRLCGYNKMCHFFNNKLKGKNVANST